MRRSDTADETMLALSTMANGLRKYIRDQESVYEPWLKASLEKLLEDTEKLTVEAAEPLADLLLCGNDLAWIEERLVCIPHLLAFTNIF